MNLIKDKLLELNPSHFMIEKSTNGNQKYVVGMDENLLVITPISNTEMVFFTMFVQGKYTGSNIIELDELIESFKRIQKDSSLAIDKPCIR